LTIINQQVLLAFTAVEDRGPLVSRGLEFHPIAERSGITPLGIEAYIAPDHAHGVNGRKQANSS
jgi:hypothetical protein